MAFKDSFKKVALTVATGGLNQLAEARSQQQLAKEGAPARARVVAFKQGWDWDSTPRWGSSDMELEVMPDVGDPYPWKGPIWVRAKIWRDLPGEPVGRELPARVDAQDREKVAIDWDAVERETAGA